MSSPNIMQLAPKFSTHRELIAAADTIPIPASTLPSTAGVKANGYKYACYRVRLTGGGADATVTVRPLFWDEASTAWVVDPGIAAKTFAKTNSPVDLPGQGSFEVLGRTFVMAVQAMGGAANPKFSFDIAGFERQF